MRRILLTTSVLAVSCATASSGPRPDERAPVAVVQYTPRPESGATEPPALGNLRAQRIRVGLSTLRDALQGWPLDSKLEPCTLVFDEKDEWLVGCPSSSSMEGFRATGETLGGYPVLHHPDSITLSAQRLPYEQVKLGLVGTVGNFKRTTEAGVEVQKPVLLIQDLEALVRNHPAFQPAAASEEWLGIFVHETFHAYQFAHPTMRQMTAKMKPGSATDKDLQALYKGNAGYAAAVDAELASLKAAFDHGTPTKGEALAVLRSWLALRQERLARFQAEFKPGTLAETDGLYTFVEGTARYVEASFARAPSDLAQALAGTDPRFEGFARTRGQPPTNLPGLSKGGERYFYALGMYASFLLDVARPDWKRQALESDRLLVGAVEDAVAAST